MVWTQAACGKSDPLGILSVPLDQGHLLPTPGSPQLICLQARPRGTPNSQSVARPRKMSQKSRHFPDPVFHPPCFSSVPALPLPPGQSRPLHLLLLASPSPNICLLNTARGERGHTEHCQALQNPIPPLLPQPSFLPSFMPLHQAQDPGPCTYGPTTSGLRSPSGSPLTPVTLYSLDGIPHRCDFTFACVAICLVSLPCAPQPPLGLNLQEGRDRDRCVS